MRTVGLFVLLITLFASPVLAAPNDEIVACTNDEIIEALTAFAQTDFAGDYANITDAMGELDMEGEGLLKIIEDVDDLQIMWWGEVVPEFPNCAGAQFVISVGGRMLDELLIAVSLGQLAYEYSVNDQGVVASAIAIRFNAHIDLWKDYEQEFLNAISDMSQQS